MFFDDFLRTGEKRKLKKMGWDSLEKNVGDPGKWGKRKNMPIYARISLLYVFRGFPSHRGKTMIKKNGLRES